MIKEDIPCVNSKRADNLRLSSNLKVKWISLKLLPLISRIFHMMFNKKLIALKALQVIHVLAELR